MKISLANTGKKHSKETRIKMSEIRKRFYLNGGVHPRGMLGKKPSQSHRSKIGEANRANKNGNWKGGRNIDRNGYVRIRIATGVYVLEHRHMIEKKIGRELEPQEVVHHIDCNRQNNKITNLMLLKNQKEHRELHINKIQ